MAACGVALVLVVAQVRPAAAFFVAVSPVLAGSLILSRFDLWPALLTAAAVAALLAERHRLGWALLGAAVAAKLWPLVLVPLALTWSVRRGRGWAALVGAGVLAAVFLPFVVLARTASGRACTARRRGRFRSRASGGAPHDVRPPAGRSRRTARRTSPGTASSQRSSSSRRLPRCSRSGSRSPAARRRASGSCATPRRRSARSSPSARCSRRSTCSGSSRSSRSSRGRRGLAATLC